MRGEFFLWIKNERIISVLPATGAAGAVLFALIDTFNFPPPLLFFTSGAARADDTASAVSPFFP